MDGSHPVKLFRHGPHQAVDIPAEFELPGEDAVMRREGNRLVIESPGNVGKLLELLATLESIDEDFGEIEDAPPRAVNF